MGSATATATAKALVLWLTLSLFASFSVKLRKPGLRWSAVSSLIGHYLYQEPQENHFPQVDDRERPGETDPALGSIYVDRWTNRPGLKRDDERGIMPVKNFDQCD